MRLTSAALLSFTVVLLLSSTAAAQGCADHVQTPEESTDAQNRLKFYPWEDGHHGGKKFKVSVGYDTSAFMAGAPNRVLRICSLTKPGQNLRLNDCEDCDKIFEAVHGPYLKDVEPDEEGNTATLYEFRGNLKPGIAPQAHPLTLIFVPQGQEGGEKARVRLDVLVGDRKGRLEVKKGPRDPQEGANAEEGRKLVEDNEVSHFKLTLSNEYDNYEVTISEVEVTSNPDRLAAEITGSDPSGKIDEKHPLKITFDSFTIPARQSKDLKVDVKLHGWWDVGHIATGPPGNARLDFKITYSDGHDRVPDPLNEPVPVRLRTPSWLLFVAVALGVVVALFLMHVWNILKYEGMGRRGVMLLVSTALAGIIATILASFGQLNVGLDQLKLRLTHDAPLLLFLLSIFATALGAPALKKLFGADDAPGGGKE